MKSRSAQVRRTKKPLTPLNEVFIVSHDQVECLNKSDVTTKKVGCKAWGLCCLPSQWTKPFIVVNGGQIPTEDALNNALIRVNIHEESTFFIRSSGVNESIESRGELVSVECSRSNILSTIARLQVELGKNSDVDSKSVHWVVQVAIPTKTKGHLSNERRLSKALRDWVAETEVSPSSPAEAHRIAIRTWRNAAEYEENELHCPYRANYVDCLYHVARWAYERQIRVHFEWVWDGRQVFIVQADPCDEVKFGVFPEELVHIPVGVVNPAKLQLFKIADEDSFLSYRKLKNASIYKGIDYRMPDFYILNNPLELALLLERGECSDLLRQDLAVLTERPLVIRTDGISIPEEKKQMLPRSDELRNVNSAVEWLVNNFRQEIIKAGLSGCNLCLIAHHFIPAAASAWCQAHPDQRRVRIESLWGIPEGLYWYAYDVFDVDTQIASIQREMAMPSSFRIRERLRYKEKFVAPDRTGSWVVQQAAAGPDWSRSIKKQEWIKEIAWTSRLIANELGKSVVVMWFIDLPRDVSSHQVMPWYHEEWHSNTTPSKAAPNKGVSSINNHVLCTSSDWLRLQSLLVKGTSVSRVRVEPTEPELVRDRDFASSLAEAAKKHKFTVELAGGILSHAFYMLSRTGCQVECIDLDDYALAEDKVEFNKLVRDKIPNVIAARGENVTLFQLEGEALIAALKRKLIEEAYEVLDATATPQIAEELADLYEVALSLAFRLGISKDEIERIRKNKSKNRGSFDRALMLTRTALTSPIAPSSDDRGENEGDSNEIRHDKTISQVSELPAAFPDVHVDKRLDSGGVLERQFSFIISSPLDLFKPSPVAFAFPTPEGAAHNMSLEVSVSRVGSDFRSKIRLINEPIQLSLFSEADSMD